MDVLNFKNMDKFLGNNFTPLFDINGLPSKIKMSLTEEEYDITTQFGRNILTRLINIYLYELGIHQSYCTSISEMYVTKLYEGYKKLVLAL
jgi:hypothetical protein